MGPAVCGDYLDTNADRLQIIFPFCQNEPGGTSRLSVYGGVAPVYDTVTSGGQAGGCQVGRQGGQGGCHGWGVPGWCTR